MVLREKDNVALGKVYITVGQDDQCDYYGTTGECIQEAINKANSLGGGTVLIKQGTYNIDSVLTLYSNTMLKGVGNATILKIPAGAYAGFNMIGATSRSNLEICNLQIDGNGANATPSSGNMHGIYLTSCTNLNIHDVYIHNNYDASIHLNNCNYFRINNNLVQDSNRNSGIVAGYGSNYGTIGNNIVSGMGADYGNGIFILSTATETNNNIAISNNILYGNYDCSIEVGVSGIGAELGNNYITVTGNVVYGADDSLTGVFVSNSNHVIVSNNYVDIKAANVPGGIVINGVDLTSNDIVVSDNIINVLTGDTVVTPGISLANLQNANINGNNITGGKIGLIADDTCSYVSIENNKITLAAQHGIKCQATHSLINGNTVTWTTGFASDGDGIIVTSDSTVVNNNVCAYNDQHGIVFDNNCDYLQCVGNSCYNNGYLRTGSGIRIRDTCTKGVINSNNCYDTQGTKTQKYGIDLSNTATDRINIIGNMLYNNLTGNLNGTGATNCVLEHNIVA